MAANKLFNLCRMLSSTTGTGTLTLGSAVTGWLTFALAGISNGDVVSYAIIDPGSSPTATEIGTGTYNSTGPTLARTSITKSTNSNAAINCSGNQHVIITPRAEDIIPNSRNLGVSGLVTGGGDLTADRTFTVGAAVGSDITTGTSTTLATTPKAVHDALATYCQFESGGVQNNTTFPIGSFLLCRPANSVSCCQHTATGVNRNSTHSVFLSTSGTDNGFGYNIVSGTAVGGTWVSRGQSFPGTPVPTTEVPSAILMQRIA